MGYRVKVCIGEELRRVVQDINHRAEDHGMSIAPVLEDGIDIVLSPAAEARVRVGPQAWRIPAIELRARKIQPAALVQTPFVERRSARGVAAATMTRAPHQIGTAVPFGVISWRGSAGCIGGKDRVPERDRPADIPGRGDFRGRVRDCGGGHVMHEIGVERAHVVVAQLRTGRTGHCRIKPVAIGRHPVAHGTAEIRKGALTDAVRRVGGDVGGADRAQRGTHLHSAGEGLAAGHAAADHAIGGALDMFPLGNKDAAARRDGPGRVEG